MSLILRVEGQPGQRFLAGVITLGRAADNDLPLADNRVSGRHGRLVRQGEGYHYEDLGSRNGSLVERAGQRRAALPGERVPVAAGDLILLGDRQTPVVIHVEAAPLWGAGGETQGTVVAHRAATADGDLGDPATLRALFALLKELSGAVEHEAVVARILEAALARFPAARCVALLQPGGAEDALAVVAARARDGGAPLSLGPELLARATRAREVIAFVPQPGDPAARQGIVAGAAAPLFSQDRLIGLLLLDSRQAAFQAPDLDWLSVVATHAAAHLVAAGRLRAAQASADRLAAENQALKKAGALARPILGGSPALTAALQQLERVAPTEATVLITGETGTGKELAARFLHAHSRRARGAFQAINCGALPEELLNSELFGHRRGAFTGAGGDRKGLFEAAAGGTLFLDEVGEISPALQVRLLRVLQEREVLPVGATRPVPVDVRVLAATHRDLEAEIAAGRFREDLYYRLSVFPVRLPPLRERGDDALQLAAHFRERGLSRHGRWVGPFSAAAEAALRRYPWPGNVRELEHAVERALILTDDGAPIEAEAFGPAISGARAAPPAPGALPEGPLKDALALLEEQLVARALATCGGNRTHAAEALGISRQALQVKLARWRARDAGG